MKIRFLFVLLACMTGVVLAQTPPSPPPGAPSPEQRLARLATLLDLTDAQKAQVKTVLDAEHEKMRSQFEAARASGTKPTPEQMHATREQQKAETLQQLNAVLSASQLKKFEVLMEQDHGPGPGPGGHRHGSPPDASTGSSN